MSRVSVAPSSATKWVILGFTALFFAVPLYALVEFTVRDGLTGNHTLDHWAVLVDGELGSEYRTLVVGVQNSLVLALLTVLVMLVILVPTMVLVRLRFPRMQPLLEFICTIPITIPAIVLVVGLAPIYSVVARIFGSGVWTLAFAYGIVVMPYAYRAVQSNLIAVDVRTLSEAARSLGASWVTVLWTVLVPNLRRGLMAASFITVAVVLGEFTIAALLNRTNLQTALVLTSASDPYITNIFVALSLAFAFLLLLAIGRVGARTQRT